MKKIIVLFIALISQISFAQNSDLTQYVNPFIGTGGHGHTYPGASVPFGMMQLSPDTRLEGWDGCSGYHFSDSIIFGFSHTHLSGTGVPDYCDILIMPFTGDTKLKNSDYASGFSHKNEAASPGFYSVLLEKYNILAEFTSTKRAGLHKYTFPESNLSDFIIDLKHRDNVIESSIEIVNNNELRGMRHSTGWARNQYVYFVIKFSKPFEHFSFYTDDEMVRGFQGTNGKNVKAIVGYKTKQNEVIYVKVGISGVSIEGALRNLDSEIPDWNFEGVINQAKEEWNKELSKIQVDGGTIDKKTIFYTALYHSMLTPNTYMDVDGNYLGRDFKIHKADNFVNYTVFSLWDTYRAEHPLLTIIDQKRTNDFINTFIAQYEQGKLLPVWELSANETYCMIGYHAVPVIADAMIKNIKGYDVYKAYEAMKHSADTSLFGLSYYRESGFVPQDKEHESVSKTLEYAYDDWCISQAAKKLEITNDMDFFRFNQRAQYYKNLFDPSTGFMRARMNGGWYKPFDPQEVNNNYTEANAWQYSFYVPQDMTGFIKLHGGKDKLSGKLDELFITESKMSGMDLSDITGLIGQYAHGNEPSHHMAYLYDYVNQPWKTQALIHKINTEFYKNDPDGLIGNEDCGQMSAWFVLSAMGFYQVCPGQLQYAIGSPLFEKVTINLENGNKFIIRAENLSDKNYYIQSAEMNGNKYNKCYITHNDIMNGGEIVFKMGSEPNKNWGARDEDVPVTSIDIKPIVKVPVIVSEKQSYQGKQTIELKTDIGEDKIYYVIGGGEPDLNSILYTKPFEINESVIIKAIAYNSEGECSKIVSAQFYKVPEGRSINILSKYSPQYTGGGDEALIDLAKGSRNWRLGYWQGYLGKDFEAVVDLGKVQFVKKVSGEFLQDVMSWICFPTDVEFEISSDGINFTKAGFVNTNMNVESKDLEIKDFGIPINKEARYIKVIAKNYGTLPKWHPGAGDPAWIFIDEILIN